MKILFFGDSITDASHDKDSDLSLRALGCGYVMQAANRLYEKSPVDYEIVNRGIGGHRIVDLYARVKKDCWNLEPDVISILIGINDIWHELGSSRNGVDLVRFEKVYRMLLEDTIARLPDAKIMLCEPFVLPGSATDEKFEAFAEVYEYAKVVKSLAEEFGLYFLPLQQKISEAAEKYGNAVILADGVHPTVPGAVIIANEWVKLFETVEEDMKK